MNELSFVAVSDDGERLIMRDGDGGEHFLELSSEVLRTITLSRRRPAPRSAPAVAVSADDGPVTPAEVQRLLRHGADVEAVAAQSGMDVEAIRSFAVPVLQERSFVAQQAGKCPVPAGGTLAEAVSERLNGRGIIEEPSWDAWRQPDGMWTVVAAFPADAGTLPVNDETATWLYDPKTRSVTAEDDTARWLTNMSDTPEPAPERVVVIDDLANEEAPAAAHLQAVPTPPSVARTSPGGVEGQLSFVEESIDLSDSATPTPEPVPVAATPQPVKPTGKPLSRRAARREAAKRKADRREPTWDEILFGVSRSEDPTI